MARIYGLLIGLVVLTLAFGVVEHLWPALRDRRRSRQSLITDLTWWGFTPLVGKTFAGIFVAVVIIGLAKLIGHPVTVDELKGLVVRHTAVTRQPRGLQFVEFLVLADVLGYWSHRAHHTV